MTRKILAALCLLAIAGCTSAPATPVAPAAVADEGVTFTSELALLGSSERKVLAPTGDMIEYVKGDVGKVVLELYRGTDTTPVRTATLLLDDGAGNNQLDDAIKFTKLGYQASYKIVAKAYHKTGGAQIDNLAKDASSCTTTFSTGLNPTVSVPRIAVQLLKDTFDGQSNQTDLDIKDGVISDVTGTETITITP